MEEPSEDRKSVFTGVLVALVLLMTVVALPGTALAEDTLGDHDPRPCVYVDLEGPGVAFDVRCVIERIPLFPPPP